MKKEFMIPKIEVISFICKDIITTSSTNGVPSITIGPGGDIGLPFDPFSED